MGRGREILKLLMRGNFEYSMPTDGLFKIFTNIAFIEDRRGWKLERSISSEHST